MAQRGVLLLAACLVCAAAFANACIFKFGSSPDSLEPPKQGTSWNHAFLGANWNGVDGAGNPWQCLTGNRQSPINLPSLGELANLQVPSNFRTQWTFPDLLSDGSNVEVINNGHVIQVEWLYNYPADVKIAAPANAGPTTPITEVLNMAPGTPAQNVTAVPLQFHFHAHSEHTINGRQFPLELHVVHRITDPALPACAGGCFSVLGILFELVNGPDNPNLFAILANLPLREGEIRRLPAGSVIPLGDMLPPLSQRNYVTYEGSLTTPPCSEGLLWHVLTQPQTISVRQWQQFLTAIGDKACTKKSASPSPSPPLRRPPPPSGININIGGIIGVGIGRRMMAAEPGTNPNDFNCTVAAYGFNYRLVQPINGRVVKAALAS